MRLVERARAALREFVLGEAAYAPGAEHYGIAPSEFSPEEYGNYIATSNAVYTCATMRAKYLSSLPLRLYKLQRNGERQEVMSGPLWELVNKVNDFWTFSRWVEMTELSLCLWGSSYTFLERGQTGRQPPREMWWGRADRVTVYPDPTNYIKGFGYAPMSGQEPLAFAPSETFWLHYPNPLNEYAGLSPLVAARISADFGTSAMRANDKIFRNGMQLSGAIFPPEKGSFSPEQARDLEGLLEKRFQGVDKAHRWAVFRHPMALQQLGWSPKDAEMLGGLKWSLEEVCRAYHWPIDLVGGQRTYENLDAAMRAAWTNCIIPEAAFIANEFTEQVLPMFPGTADVAVFDTAGIAVLQENRGELVAQIATLATQGVPLNRLLQEFMPQLLPPNQQGYPWGDVWWAQGTLVPVENAEPRPAPAPVVVTSPAEEPVVEEPTEEEPAEEPTEQVHGPAKQRGIEYGSAEHQRADKTFQEQIAPWERKMAEMTRGLFTRLQASVQDRLSQRGARNVEDVVKAPFERPKWTKIFRAIFRDLLVELIGDVMKGAAVDLGVSFSPDMADPNVVRFLENRSQRFAEEVLETTWVQLKESLSEGVQAGEGIPELAGRVDTVMDSRKSSAETIARTEVVSSVNAGAAESWRQSGVVTGKSWLAALDERTRETHVAAHGQEVGLDEPFTVGGEELMYPGDSAGSAENVINCRCALRPVVKQ